MALRAKNRAGKAESAGFGNSKHKRDNEVWAALAATRRDGANSPHFFVARRFNNLLQSVLLAHRTKKSWSSSPPFEVVLTGHS
jgi:hypothetical protein